MEGEKYLMELQLLEQQANHFDEQLQIINQQITELMALKNNLKEFAKTKESEVYSEFGKGIFFRSKIGQNQLLVDVGAGVLVPKTFEEVAIIIDEQINKFENIKPEIAESIEKINLRLDKIVNLAKNENEKKETNKDRVSKPTEIKKEKKTN